MAAALVGISLSSAFVGANLAISYLAVPSLLLPAPSKAASNPATPSAHLARQWRSIYSHAMPIAITGSAISSASFVYAALQVPGSQSMQRNLLFAAASMAVFVVPYTLTLMAPTNSVLMERAKAGDMMEDSGQGDATEVGMPKAQGLSGCQTEELLSRWVMLNYGRAAIPAIGIVCAIVALLQ
jgi:Domain of unknown function (DUF1772)